MLITPEYLRELADASVAEAERLYESAKAKRVEAIRLRREADALEQALALAPPVEHMPSARAELAGEIAAYLARCRKPKSSTEVADFVGVSAGRAREALAFLVECKMVHRTGLKRGTRYRILRDGEAAPAEPQPFGQRWEEHVRDIVCDLGGSLGVFTLADVQAELEHVSPVTVRRWVTVLADKGILAVERVGNRNVYAYEPPEASPAPRRVETAPGRRRGSVVIQGTGKGGQPARSEVRKMVRAAEAQGAEVKPQKHGYAIVKDGETVASIPRTPSDHRSLKNARAVLKSAGIDA